MKFLSSSDWSVGKIEYAHVKRQAPPSASDSPSSPSPGEPSRVGGKRGKAAGIGPADVRRRQVVTRAAELFDQAGYHTTSMAEVADAVGLEKPSLYHYFSGKDEILFWIHEEFIDLLISKMEARSNSDLSATEELRLVMHDVLRLMDTHRGHVRVFFEHYRELPEEGKAGIRAKRDRYTAYVKEIIVRGTRDGEFRAVDPTLTTFAIFGMCNWTYKWYRSDGPDSSDQIAEFFFELLDRGLRA